MQADVQTTPAAAAVPLAAPKLGRWANANELPVIDFAPISGSNEEAKERVAREVHDACRDIGFLTIVNHPVPPVENSFVVNIGDSMRMWTNNRFASTLHRVVNHYGRERYSVGVFANPDYDTLIRPLSTCVDAEHPPTFDKMLSGEALLYLYSRVWPSKGEPEKVSTY